MSKLLKTEWKKIKLPVLCMIVLLSVATCILTSTIHQNYTLNYDLEAWEVGTKLIIFLFPNFVVIPICWNLYYERKNNFLVYAVARVKQGKYLRAKWMVSAISAFMILFISFFLSAIFALYIKAPIEPYVPPADLDVTPFNHVFLDLFTKSPLLYAFALSTWRGVLGILVMSFGFVISLYVSNIFLILTGPFIYLILENFILSILGVPQYRLITSFDPTSLSESMITANSFLMGPMILSIIILGVWIYFAKIKHTAIVKV